MSTIYEKYSSKQLFLGGLLLPALLGVVVLVGSSLSSILPAFGKEERILGNKNAKVKMVEYSDFQCPFCLRSYPTLKEVVKKYGDQISFEYKHFPLSFHPMAQKAAEASECAGEQGRFWAMHDKLFENQEAFSVENFKQWAGDIGLNKKTFAACLDEGRFAAKVQADATEGSSLGVDGTPTTFVNGTPVVGAQPLEAFTAAIDAALK